MILRLSTQNWQTLIAGSDEFYLQGLKNLESTMLLKGRKNGVDQNRIPRLRRQ